MLEFSIITIYNTDLFFDVRTSEIRHAVWYSSPPNLGVVCGKEGPVFTARFAAAISGLTGRVDGTSFNLSKLILYRRGFEFLLQMDDRFLSARRGGDIKLVESQSETERYHLRMPANALSIQPGPKRNNLVVVRAGDQSLHSQWLANADICGRNWDLYVSYFGDNDIRCRGEFNERIKGNKWEPLYELSRNGVFEDYEYIWLPDDDLSTDSNTINSLFDMAREHRLLLAQPALTRDSFHSFSITLRDPRYRLRFTSTIEQMAPLFSREALRQCAHTFKGRRSGWGLEAVWSKLLGNPIDAIAIVDSAPVRHTRPAGSGYDLQAALSDMSRLLAEYGVIWDFSQLGGVLCREDLEQQA